VPRSGTLSLVHHVCCVFILYFNLKYYYHYYYFWENVFLCKLRKAQKCITHVFLTGALHIFGQILPANSWLCNTTYYKYSSCIIIFSTGALHPFCQNIASKFMIFQSNMLSFYCAGPHFSTSWVLRRFVPTGRVTKYQRGFFYTVKTVLTFLQHFFTPPGCYGNFGHYYASYLL